MKNLKVGDRVVVPFPIACGELQRVQGARRTRSARTRNPNAWIAEKMLGHSPAGIFGYSHLTGGFAGGQAEYARVPFADVGPLKVPDGLTDEQVLFLSDILPTGYMGAEMCGIKPGDTVAVWGCGPVGQFAIASAYLLGAERVIAHRPLRVPPARWRARRRARSRSTTRRSTASPTCSRTSPAGRGPDHCIDAVGVEGHTHGVQYVHDRAKQIDAHADRPADRAARGDHVVRATAARSR